MSTAEMVQAVVAFQVMGKTLLRLVQAVTAVTGLLHLILI
jgi:hypothetical protein